MIFYNAVKNSGKPLGNVWGNFKNSDLGQKIAIPVQLGAAVAGSYGVYALAAKTVEILTASTSATSVIGGAFCAAAALLVAIISIAFFADLAQDLLKPVPYQPVAARNPAPQPAPQKSFLGTLGEAAQKPLVLGTTIASLLAGFYFGKK